MVRCIGSALEMARGREKLAPFSRLFLQSWLLISVLLIPVLLMFGSSPAMAQVSQDPQAEARRLVRLLGSPSFAERQAAHQRLLRLHNDAYDVLLDASDDDDIEIRLASRSLLEHLQIRWSRPTDPAEVRRILESYGERAEGERSVDIQRLARIPDGAGRAALARVIRYEPSETLSRRAALLLLAALPDSPRVPLEPETDSTVNAVAKELNGSLRLGVTWVRAYLTWRHDPDSGLKAFEPLVRSAVEHAQLSPTSANEARNVALTLARHQAQMRLATGEDSLDDLTSAFGTLVDDDEPSIKEHLDWLASLNQPSAIVAWARQNEELHHDRPEVLFRVAEAQLKLGSIESAEATFDLAIKATPQAFEDREVIAHSLQSFGHSESAVRLLSVLHQQAVAGSDEHWRTGIDLASWHRYRLEWDQAAELLAALVERAEGRADGWIAIRSPQDRDWIRGERYWVQANRLIAQAGSVSELSSEARNEYLAALDQALELRPYDARLLVARHQACLLWNSEQTEVWETKIAARCDDLRQRVRDAKHDLNRFPVPSVRLQLERELAERSAELAKLLLTDETSNAEALAAAKTALEYCPEHGEFWHVLAEVQAQAKNWPAAIKAQQTALVQSPERVAWAEEINSWTRIAAREPNPSDATGLQR